MDRPPVVIRWYAPASVEAAATGPKSVVGARSEPAGSSEKEPSGDSQSRKMSARATTTRALAPLEVLTVKVPPAWERPVTLPAVAAGAAGADPDPVAARAVAGPATASPATARAAASSAASGVRRARREGRRRGGGGSMKLIGQLLVRSGKRTHRFGMLPAR